MAITVNNSLSGPAGVQPSASSLAATARTGTVGIDDPALASYSSAETVHALTSVRVDSGHHRFRDTSGQGDATPRFTFALPSAPWWVRWYMRLPAMQVEGRGIEECRWVLRVGGRALILHETAGGNIGLRLQPDDLWSVGFAPELGGSATAINQVLRVEVTCDGTDTTVEVYAGHATTGVRSAVWSGVALSGSTAELGSFRWHRHFELPYGNTSYSQDVADYQQHCMDLGYPAPEFGADGFYGSEFQGQLEAFQADYGLPVGAGSAEGGVGPETCSAIDLAVRLEVDSTGYWPASWISHVAVSDSGWIGPASTPSGTATGALTADGVQTATRQALGTATAPSSVGAASAGTTTRSGTAAAAAGVATAVGGASTRTGAPVAPIGFDAAAAGAKSVGGSATTGILVGSAVEGAQAASATAPLTVGAAAAGSKRVSSPVAAGVGIGATAAGFKRTSGTAAATLLVDATATQVIEPIPGVTGAASVVGHLAGGAAVMDHIGGHVASLGRLGGAAERS